jgi:vacuolar-type H+-ATPase subunit C/Vma6
MELRNLKLSELKELAKSKGIHDAYKYKKDELILKLNEIESDNNDESKETINDSKIPEDKKETEQEMEFSVYCLMRHMHHLNPVIFFASFFVFIIA